MPVSLLESQLDTLEVEAEDEMIATIQGEEPSADGDVVSLCAIVRKLRINDVVLLLICSGRSYHSPGLAPPLQMHE